jgi:hypothetical protein
MAIIASDDELILPHRANRPDGIFGNDRYCQCEPIAPSFDWHDAPESQYVITLAGTLEFTTRDGETFIIRPCDFLVPADTAGTGHKWRLIDDAPWRRCYLVLKPDAADLFAANG